MVNLLLFTIAVVLFIVLLPVAVVYAAIETVTGILGRVAVSIDMTGNVLLASVMNDVMIKDDGYKFGNRKETISSVLGKNKRDKSLRVGGKVLCNILDFIDTDHCMKSIDNKI